MEFSAENLCNSDELEDGEIVEDRDEPVIDLTSGMSSPALEHYVTQRHTPRIFIVKSKKYFVSQMIYRWRYGHKWRRMSLILQLKQVCFDSCSTFRTITSSIRWMLSFVAEVAEESQVLQESSSEVICVEDLTLIDDEEEVSIVKSSSVSCADLHAGHEAYKKEEGIQLSLTSSMKFARCLGSG